MMRVLSLFFIFTGGVSACSVPVFRYALEHWPADPFRITLFHRGALSAEQRALVPAEPLANAKAQTVDLDDNPEPEMVDLWRRQGTDRLPWVVLRFPQLTGIETTVVSGPLDQMSAQLFESPARREIIERLGAGESAVWVFLESGDKTKDDAAAALIEKRLEYLMGVLSLPKLDEQDIVNGLVSIAEEDLRLAFSMLRIARSDPAEQILMEMLLKSERDLAQMREPMVFPIFGRGRALYALAGAGIRHETIDRAADFLIGKCSCQVKEQNPGVDLLLRADWSSLIKTAPELARQLPTLAEINKLAPVAVTAEPKPAAAPTSDAATAGRKTFVTVAIIYVVSPLMMAVAVLMIWKRRHRR